MLDTTTLLHAGLVIVVLLLGCTAQTDIDGEIGSGVRGRVLSESDVATMPDAPLSALIMAVSSEQMKGLLEETGADSERAPTLVNIELAEELFERYVAGHDRSEEDGRFEIELVPGDYHLCLANFNVSADESMLPARMWGCAEVSVSSEEWLEVEVLWGEAGVRAR